MSTNFIESLQTRKDSNLIAVSEKTSNWTYKEFVEDVYKTRTYFLRNGIEKVLIALPQSYYAYIIEWAAYSAGITFCPVNISTPADRLQYFINQFEPDLIFSNEVIKSEITQLKPTIFFESNSETSDITFPNKNLEIAYVIFTSGSTGLPKGVMVKRTGLDNFLRWSTKEYSVGESDVWGQFSNLGFDLSICDIFTAIIKGACLVPIASQSEKLLPGIVIKNKKITFWHSVPSVIDVMSKAKQINSETLATLHSITFCGEKLFSTQLEMLFAAKPDLIVYNTYGPTEATIFCTYLKLTKDNYKDFCQNTISIGQTIEGYEIHLNQPENSLGEIVILGENLAKGYIKDVKNTAFGTFFHNNQSKKAYFTGDYGEKINGNTYFVCRKDSQIKLMGHRIDLREIDYELRNFGCYASISTFHQNKIITFVVVDDFDEERTRLYLAQKLPVYYIPSLIIAKERFEYNNSGKIDLKQLLNSVEYLFE